MIVNTGNRTDIPAFYSDWFFNRLEAGFVYVRNPYFRNQITSYRLSPEVVDILAFCTKNPVPMMSRLHRLKPYRQFWHMTITPYGRDVEPHVPPAEDAIEAFRELSALVGPGRVQWRYDPIFLNEGYPLEFHLDAFDHMASRLQGTTDTCIISFIDLYEKTKRNFPGVEEVSHKDQIRLAQEFVTLGKRYAMGITACAEGHHLARYGVETGGCATREVYEKACAVKLSLSGTHRKRDNCPCLLGIDIGEYSTCGHGCLYCYANLNERTVKGKMALHDPLSPLLIGFPGKEEVVKKAVQKSYVSSQGTLF